MVEIPSPQKVDSTRSRFYSQHVLFQLGLKSTMDNMDDHPPSSIGLEGVWMVIHGSSRGSMDGNLDCLKEVFHP